jgi:hypothetical protein
MTREMSAAWVKEAVLVLDGAAPSRHFWSRWMDRALAPHAGQMQAPEPIPANDVAPDENDPEDDDEDLRAHMSRAESEAQILRVD